MESPTTKTTTTMMLKAKRGSPLSPRAAGLAPPNSLNVKREDSQEYENIVGESEDDLAAALLEAAAAQSAAQSASSHQV